MSVSFWFGISSHNETYPHILDFSHVTVSGLDWLKQNYNEINEYLPISQRFTNRIRSVTESRINQISKMMYFNLNWVHFWNNEQNEPGVLFLRRYVPVFLYLFKSLTTFYLNPNGIINIAPTQYIHLNKLYDKYKEICFSGCPYPEIEPFRFLMGEYEYLSRRIGRNRNLNGFNQIVRRLYQLEQEIFVLMETHSQFFSNINPNDFPIKVQQLLYQYSRHIMERENQRREERNELTPLVEWINRMIEREIPLSSYKEERPELCPICYEDYTYENDPLSCGHHVCTSCIVNSKKTSCPFCRQEVYICIDTLTEIYNRIYS